MPAYSGSQIEEGLEEAKLADCVFEFEHAKHRIKDACPLRKPHRKIVGRSQPRWFGSRNAKNKPQDQGCLPVQEARSRTAWKEPTMLIEFSNCKMQSAGSWLPCPLRKPTQGRLGTSQTCWLGSQIQSQSAASRLPAHSWSQIEEGLEGANRFRIGTVKAQGQGCLPAQEARSRKAWKEPTTLVWLSNWNSQSTGSRLPACSGSQVEEGLEGANHADWDFKLEDSKRRIKVACQLRKPDRGGLGRSQPSWLGLRIITF